MVVVVPFSLYTVCKTAVSKHSLAMKELVSTPTQDSLAHNHQLHTNLLVHSTGTFHAALAEIMTFACHLLSA